MDIDISKYLLLYLCMALAVSFFFPQTILGTGEESILGIFNVGINETTNQPYIVSSGFANSDLNAQIGGDEKQSGFWHVVQAGKSLFQWVVDGLSNVLSTLKILFKFLFSPFIFVLNPALLGGAPFYVKMIFAIPLVFIVFMSSLKFIRGMI